MATYYWVGGSGTWDGSTTTNWAASSGGAGSAGFPTSADNVTFDSLSNATAYTVTMGASAVCADMTMAGPLVGKVTWAGSTALTIAGSMNLSGGTAGITRSYTGTITFSSTASGKTLTSNGVALGGPLTFDGVGGGWTQADAITATTITLTNGAFSDGGFSVSATSFSSSNSNTRDCAIAGTWSLSGVGTVWTTATNTGLTYSTNSGTVSLTSSGSGTHTITCGASAPTMPKILVASGSYVLNLTSVNCKGLDFTGSTVTCSSAPRVAGALTLATGGSYTSFAPTMSGTSGTQSITSSGKTIFTLTVDGVGGTASCVDALTCSNIMTVTNGIFSCNGQSVSSATLSSSNANTRGITFTGSEVWSVTSAGIAWDCGTSTNLTITPATGSVKFTSTSATSKTFAGGGKTYATVYFSGSGTGDNIVTGSNTFAEIKADGTAGVKTISLTAGTTTILSAAALNISGDATHQTVFRSTSAGSAATLSCASGTISLSYVSVKDSTATGGATFNAFTSNGCVNTSGNTGWNFSASAFIAAANKIPLQAVTRASYW